ncbi:DUF167 domain-containing protein [Noviherbaspirillum autotrophicum]|uniref:UPF0235 protein TSA66_10035 n=1 Tax=Noviherbaspirillum autotrophicum TaxID=709839 RepID=A0A0C2BM48_9BURK|nr:DUF167 domain-containing protein [Noviherbaspirillum autotrophicum]KIF81069.1 hypothetical protein TSA66_10035 [Noviherbaspirillum autotrophicum]
MKDWCSVVPRGIRLTVQIMPNAKKSEVIGVLDDALKIRLHAQPIEGKANDALVRYLADVLDVPKSAVTITHGHTSKRKMIEIVASQLTPEKVRLALFPGISH